VNTLGGYDVLAELDTGGMGDVLIARKRSVAGFERLVALKTIRQDIADVESLKAMFADEARLLGRLHHSGIAQVYDFGEDRDRLYLAMELVAGIDFDELALREPPPEIACLAMAEALRALHAAHELKDRDGSLLGVVHRDVSPGNLMLTYEGNVKVLDFGIALVRGREAPVTEFGTLKGKPPYMAPEQVKSEAIDRRTDVFSACAVLWELLTGARLFSGDSVFAIARSIELDQPEPPSARRPALPEGLDEVVLYGLNKRPEDRYQTALELAEDLEQIAANCGAEPLARYARRELAGDRAEHETYIAELLSDRKPERRGRGTAVHTVPAAEVADTDPAEDRARDPEPRTWWPLALAVLILLGGAVGVTWTFFARTTPVVALEMRADAAAAPIDAAPMPDAVAPVALVDAAQPPIDAARPPVDARRVTTPRPPKKRDAAPTSRPRIDAAPVPREVEYGELKVLANDPFALVFIDGVDHGATPTRYIRLPAGPHVVVWKEPDTGKVRKRQSVVVKPGGKQKIRAASPR
jgi:serine/threonine-protein kinase